MIGGETVLAGAEHPGTQLEVMVSAAGYYLGYRTKDGEPYSRETTYLSQGAATQILRLMRTR